VLDVLHTERENMKAGRGSELMDILISKKWADRFGGFTNDPLTQS